MSQEQNQGTAPEMTAESMVNVNDVAEAADCGRSNNGLVGIPNGNTDENFR